MNQICSYVHVQLADILSDDQLFFILKLMNSHSASKVPSPNFGTFYAIIVWYLLNRQ